MKKAVLIIGCVMMLIGCVRHVKGDKMDISIKRTPTCKLTLKMDGALILEATAKKPCMKE